MVRHGTLWFIWYPCVKTYVNAVVKTNMVNLSFSYMKGLNDSPAQKSHVYLLSGHMHRSIAVHILPTTDFHFTRWCTTGAYIGCIVIDLDMYA